MRQDGEETNSEMEGNEEKELILASDERTRAVYFMKREQRVGNAVRCETRRGDI